MSRIEAELHLHQMRDGVFLIRERDTCQGEYATALRWKHVTKHIKICQHPNTRRFYVSDVADFKLLQDLVHYYQANSLGISFPGVDTTLRYPFFKEEMKQLWAEVLFNFKALYPDELSIEKHGHVQILKKETDKSGWWYGECSDRTGLFPSNYVRELI